MAFNICVNCGTNLNHILGVYEYELENYKANIENEEDLKYSNNLIFIKYNIDRLCCRTFIISFIDYVPSNM